MDIRETFDGNVTVLHLYGELTGAARYQLRQYVDGVLAKRSRTYVPAGLVLVFHDAGMDKGGMYEVRYTQSKCELRLVAPPPRPDGGPWPEGLVCPSEERAVRSIGRQRPVPPLSITEEWQDGVWVLDLVGALCAENAEMLLATVESLGSPRHMRLLLRLGGLSRIDSAGLGCLGRVVRLMSENRGRARMLDPPLLMRRVIDPFMMVHYFGVCGSEEEAMEALRVVPPADTEEE